MSGVGVLAFAQLGRYAQDMSDAANAYELPADQTVPADVANEAAEGEVVYLSRDGKPVAALVSANAADCLEALEDAADIIVARRALAEQAPSIPADEVWAELGVDDPCDNPPLRAPLPARRRAAAAQAPQ
jgi:antitoxin (DNA-binding transcriptional repressor) of toxin-antitoxin stability system